MIWWRAAGSPENFCLDGEDIYGNMDVNLLQEARGHGVPETKSLSNEHV